MYPYDLCYATCNTYNTDAHALQAQRSTLLLLLVDDSAWVRMAARQPTRGFNLGSTPFVLKYKTF
jgi:hypothetical protein